LVPPDLCLAPEQILALGCLLAAGPTQGQNEPDAEAEAELET
jgi:hypothetical protein